MADAVESVEIDPVVCTFCHQPILEEEKFVEILTNKGVKVPDNRGYLKGAHSEPHWVSDSEYVHLKHIYFAALVE